MFLCAMRRTMGDLLTAHENVPNFGTEELHALLGDVYYLTRAVISPAILGWAAKRPHQHTILVRMIWLHKVLAAAEAGRLYSLPAGRIFPFLTILAPILLT